MPTSSLLTVLTYHRIDEPDARPELDPGLISAVPAEFRRHAAWIATYANPISLDDLQDVRDGRATLPRRAVLVTFDDAYRDFADHAWPALRRHGVPVTLFVPTAFPGARGPGFWWDRLHRAVRGTDRRAPLDTPAGRLALATPTERDEALRRLVRWVHAAPDDEASAVIAEIATELGEATTVAPVLGWPQLRRLAAEGVTVAPHSRTHARLDRVPADRVREEVAAARADLERELGHCPAAFAYPAGGHDAETRQVLEQAGIDLAFTTRDGVNDLAGCDWLALRRTNVGRRSTLTVLRLRVRPWPGRAMNAMARACR
jgi:peptidoglycan/xylan/chitin deacetylase (PgdA/CDA1 family)